MQFSGQNETFSGQKAKYQMELYVLQHVDQNEICFVAAAAAEEQQRQQSEDQRVLFLSNKNIQVAFKETDNSKSDCFFFISLFFLAYFAFLLFAGHSFHFFRLDGALANNFVRVPPKGQAQHIAWHLSSEFFV